MHWFNTVNETLLHLLLFTRIFLNLLTFTFWCEFQYYFLGFVNKHFDNEKWTKWYYEYIYSKQCTVKLPSVLIHIHYISLIIYYMRIEKPSLQTDQRQNIVNAVCSKVLQVKFYSVSKIHRNQLKWTAKIHSVFE